MVAVSAFFSGSAAYKWNFVDFTICSNFLQNGVVILMSIDVVTHGQIQVSMESHEAESGRLSESTIAHNFQGCCCCDCFLQHFWKLTSTRARLTQAESPHQRLTELPPNGQNHLCIDRCSKLPKNDLAFL